MVGKNAGLEACKGEATRKHTNRAAKPHAHPLGGAILIAAQQVQPLLSSAHGKSGAIGCKAKGAIGASTEQSATERRYRGSLIFRIRAQAEHDSSPKWNHDKFFARMHVSISEVRGSESEPIPPN